MGQRPEEFGVLVVDDDDAIRTSLAEIFRSYGYMVAVAEDGSVALEHLRSVPVGAMVLDISMPVLDGLELLDKLDDPPPVVLLTAREYDADVMKRRSKVALYMQKPVSPTKLLAAVAQLISAGSKAN